MSFAPLALVGTTASGKSAVAMAVAQALGDVEILCVDSMCVYQEMDIGTAKPTRADQALVAHHLLDLVDPSQEFSVAEFQRATKAAIAEVQARGHQPLLVGGTGLYHRAVIDDLELPGRYPEVANGLWDRLVGGEDLFAELERLDPVAASRMEPDNDRRVVRALEVTVGSGRPFSSYGPGLESYGTPGIAQVGLSYHRAEVDEAIAERVGEFMARGFLDEVERLARRPRGMSRTARQAVGYRELLSHLEDGIDLDRAVGATVRATKKLARRQWAWFGRDPRITWVEPSEAQEALRTALLAARAEVPD